MTNPPGDTTPVPAPGDTGDSGSDTPDTGDQVTVGIPNGPVNQVNGDWAVTSITPRFGYLGTSSFVSITGSFPREVSVWFGERPGTVYSQTDGWLVVRAPRANNPMVVPISFFAPSGEEVLRVEDGYAFIPLGQADGATVPDGDLGDGSGTDGGSTSGSGGSGRGGDGGGRGSGSGGSGGGGTTDGGGTDGGSGTDSPDGTDPGTGDGSTTDGGDGAGDNGDDSASDDADTDIRQRRAVASGDPIDNGNGLLVRPIDGLAGLAATPVCISDPCRVRPISG